MTTDERCERSGWIEVARVDETRGLWARVTGQVIELCSGRHGDDEIVTLELGEVVSERHLHDMREVLHSFTWARALMAEEQNCTAEGQLHEEALAALQGP